VVQKYFHIYFSQSSDKKKERGEFMLRRKEIYEALHPETKRGTAGAIASNKAQGNATADSAIVSAPSFVSNTAQKIGVSERVIREELQLASDLTPETKEVIKAADITKTDALKLARLNPKEQNAAIEQVTNKQASNITDAINEVQHKPHAASNSGNNECYATREVMGGIDLDPAFVQFTKGRDS
jgi:hypothetical protein